MWVTVPTEILFPHPGTKLEWIMHPMFPLDAVTALLKQLYHRRGLLAKRSDCMEMVKEICKRSQAKNEAFEMLRKSSDKVLGGLDLVYPVPEGFTYTVEQLKEAGFELLNGKRVIMLAREMADYAFTTSDCKDFCGFVWGINEALLNCR